MSKAFTKDDGPEASPLLRRRPPLPEGSPNYVTHRGLRALRDELARLDASPASAMAPEARAAWRAELEHRIATALVPEPPERHDEVRFGALVELEDGEGRSRKVEIVGVDEADGAHGLVAFTAPLARALLGRRVGDVVSVKTPRGQDDLTIVDIARRPGVA